MNDRFTAGRTYITATPKKPSKDYDAQYIDVLSKAGFSVSDKEKVKDAIAEFRTDFGIPWNKHLNKDLKERWLNFYKSTH